MNKNKIIEETESFFKNNIPKTRITKSYLKHVLGTQKYALELAKIYNADRFIVEIAALLHDVGADTGNKHAQESAKIAKTFLLKFNIPKDILNRIIKCIERHSMDSKAERLEEQIMQDADGIIFIEDTYKFFLEKQKNKFSLEEAKKLSLEKTKGMMDKIKTEKGIELAEKLLPEALKYLKTAG